LLNSHVLDSPRSTPEIESPSFVAVDLSFDHLAAVLVDCWGSPVRRMALQFPDAGMDEGKAPAPIGDAVRSRRLLAKSRNDGIAIEKRMGRRIRCGPTFQGALPSIR
jgi:hypothetical protein